jgi:hypothetical protein
MTSKRKIREFHFEMEATDFAYTLLVGVFESIAKSLLIIRGVGKVTLNGKTYD